MLVLVLAATLSAAGAPLKVAAPGLSSSQMSPEMVSVLTDQLTTQLGLRGMQVVSATEIATVLGLERQKELLGCGESQCLLELGQALGAEAVLVGSMGRFGDTFQVNLKLINANTAAPLALFSTEASSEKELPHVMTRAAESLARDAGKGTGRPTLTPDPVKPGRVKLQDNRTRVIGTWTMLGAGALVAGGIVLAAVTAPNSEENTAGGLLILLGGGALVTGLILYFVGGQEEVPVAVNLGLLPHGWATSLSGRF